MSNRKELIYDAKKMKDLLEKLENIPDKESEEYKKLDSEVKEEADKVLKKLQESIPDIKSEDEIDKALKRFEERRWKERDREMKELREREILKRREEREEEEDREIFMGLLMESMFKNTMGHLPKDVKEREEKEILENPSDVYISIKPPSLISGEEDLTGLIKKNFKKFGQSSKFMSETFGVSTLGQLVGKIYLDCCIKDEWFPLFFHHGTYLKKIKRLLKKCGYKKIITSEFCDYCQKVVYKEGENRIKLCSICKSGYYCSKECQTRDWKIHKKECKKQ